MTKIDPVIINLANKVEVVFSDFDGVFTNNQILEGASYKAKWRSYYDGQGVSLLRAIGLHLCLITNEKGDSAEYITAVVEKWNSLPSSSKTPHDGGWEPVRLFTDVGGARKVEVAIEFLVETGWLFSDSAFMGDDLVDVPLLQKVALRAAPTSGDPAVKAIAHFISERPGGMGAFRDFANFILQSRGIDPFSLPPQ